MKRFLMAVGLSLAVTCAVVAWRRGCCRGGSAWNGDGDESCSCGCK
jgi:hypothetical protein